MALLRPDFYNRVPAWVKKDPRRLQLFMQLLNEAEQDGYAEFSVRGYAQAVGITHSAARSLMCGFESRHIIETINNTQTTLVFICDSGLYIESTAHQQHTNSTPTAHSNEIQKEKQEKKPSPHTPYKEEKEKKENAEKEVTTFQKKEEKPRRGNFEAVKKESAVSPGLPAESLDVRRQRFWADCRHCAARHADWPAEAVRSFFLFWSELNQAQTLMKFELEPTWGISHRMASYVQHGRWLTELAAARLSRVRGVKPKTEQDRQREQQARSIFEEEHNERERQWQERQRKKVTREEAMTMLERGEIDLSKVKY